MITTQCAQKHSTSAPRPSIIPSGSAGPDSHSFGEMHTDVCPRDFPHAGDRVPRGLAEVQAGLGIPAPEDLHRLRRRPTERATPLVRAVDDLLATYSAVQRWRVTERGARLAGTVVARKFLVPPRVHAGGRQPQAGQPGSRLPLAGQDCWRRAGGA